MSYFSLPVNAKILSIIQPGIDPGGGGGGTIASEGSNRWSVPVFSKTWGYRRISLLQLFVDFFYPSTPHIHQCNFAVVDFYQFCDKYPERTYNKATVTIGPQAKRHPNGVSLAGR